MAYVRYDKDTGMVRDVESEIIAGIIATMTRESQDVARRDGEAARISHAKSTALMTGVLTVLPDLPVPLRQGCLPTRATILCCFGLPRCGIDRAYVAIAMGSLDRARGRGLPTGENCGKIHL